MIRHDPRVQERQDEANAYGAPAGSVCPHLRAGAGHFGFAACARLTALELGELKTLRQEYEQVVKLIARLKGILSSEKKLVGVIQKELLEIKEKYAVPRRTQLCRLETAHASELQVKSRQSPAIFSLPKQAISSAFR